MVHKTIIVRRFLRTPVVFTLIEEPDGLDYKFSVYVNGILTCTESAYILGDMCLRDSLFSKGCVGRYHKQFRKVSELIANCEIFKNTEVYVF